MEEKKLTDEEIIKAWDICNNTHSCVFECPYFNKHGRNFCMEGKALYKDIKRILQEYAEQKAEIERLTEENENLDGCAKQFLADYQKCEIANVELQELNAKYYNEAKDLRRENAELQKQVDELKKDLRRSVELLKEGGELAKMNEQIITQVYAQTAKDTAKEILEWLLGKAYVNKCIDLHVNEVKSKFKERYGVEVE